MDSLKDVLVIIPARAGSKGIPGKNLRKLHGKPLLQYSVEAAQKVFDNPQIALSTDSVEMQKLGLSLGLNVPSLRPKEFAGNRSPMRDVLLHELRTRESQNFKRILLLQPTCPFRRFEDIPNVLGLWNSALDMVVSVYETDANPYYNLFEENNLGLLSKSKPGNYTDRQSCPAVYKYNGNIYLINVNSIKSMVMSDFTSIAKYKMPKEISIDMDQEIDWKFAEFLLSEKIVQL